ncbi:MAG: ATP-binding cassette domain-containing protein [Candidatus Levybacteria bacterium]|nr:ATP-binding cassette domain-containing protein [Candidatus Levybacteria bacterium]
MILFHEVSKKYGNDYGALESVTFTIPQGEFAYLIGPTGSGKTTIFRLIIRDLVPTEGNIMLGEWDIIKLPKKKIPTLRRKVGVIFQDLKLLFDRTVEENVMLPLLFSGVKEDEARLRAQEALSEVALGDSFEKFPIQLSGGERQRVAIARALVFRPEILLADEPTGNLDIKTSQQIVDLLKAINKKGTTIFMATHNETLIGSSDRVIKLEHGKLIEDKNKKHEKSHSSHEESSKKEADKTDKKEGKEKDAS